MGLEYGPAVLETSPPPPKKGKRKKKKPPSFNLFPIRGVGRGLQAPIKTLNSVKMV